jgi:glycosyltransferase involved in cell wall biosynthesis
VRVVAILASYYEERFIGACLENLFEQGAEAYLIDNGSTDRTVDIAERYLKRVPHALSKWVNRKYDETEVEKGWHGGRASLTPDTIRLPSQKELHYYTSDDELDTSTPLTRHLRTLAQEEDSSTV